MKKIILLSLIPILFGCENNSPAPSGNTNNNNSNSTNGFDAQIILLLNVSNDPVTHAVKSIYQPTCIFKSSPSTLLYPSVDAGAVSVNGIVLQKIDLSGSYTYQDSTNLISSFPMSWNVTGSSSFPALSFIDQGNEMPSFSNYSQLPDTINKANGFTFTLANLVHSDLTEFKINPGTSNEISTTAVNGVISLSAVQLSSLPNNSFTTIEIKCYRNTNYNRIVNNKTLQFTCSSVYNKYGLVLH